MEATTAAGDTPEDAQEGVEGDGVQEERKKHLSNSQRNQILQSLLSKSDGANLNYGAVSFVAKEFGVTRQTVSAIWKRARQSVVDGGGAMVVEHRKSKCGRKKKNYQQQLQDMAQIPVHQRRTIRSKATAMGVSTWAVWRMTKQEIKRHSRSTE